MCVYCMYSTGASYLTMPCSAKPRSTNHNQPSLIHPQTTAAQSNYILILILILSSHTSQLSFPITNFHPENPIERTEKQPISLPTEESVSECVCVCVCLFVYLDGPVITDDYWAGTPGSPKSFLHPSRAIGTFFL